MARQQVPGSGGNHAAAPDGIEIIPLHRDPKGRESRRLARAAFEQIFRPTWPAYSKLEDWREWLSGMPEHGKAEGQPGRFLSVMVQNRGTPQEKVLGLTYGLTLPESGAAFSIYTAVREGQRGQGLGRRLFEARGDDLSGFFKQQGSELAAIYFEVNDPAKTDAKKDVMDPATRITVFRKLGAELLPFDYVQPQFESGEPAVSTFRLMRAIPPGGQPKPGNGPAMLRQFFDYMSGDDLTPAERGADEANLARMSEAFQRIDGPAPASPSGPASDTPRNPGAVPGVERKWRP
jgi:GNAT superfamily N-acetyltransferase